MQALPVQPIRLLPAQSATAVEVLIQAFQTDPLYTKLIPNETQRTQSLRWLWGAVVHSSLIVGEVYTTPTLSGVACWLSPGNVDLNLWQMIRTGLALPRAVMRFHPETRSRMLKIVNRMDQVRHELMSGLYWYLWLLGVEPAHQGQGIGGMLIQPVLDRADAAGIPCYLETETERNVAFYQKRRFQIIHEENIDWLGQKAWMMRREPMQ